MSHLGIRNQCTGVVWGAENIRIPPRTLVLGKWCPGAEFDAYLQRQFVTESNNINSLASHRIWSTIKTLPTTLPEPSSMDRGPRTGITEAVSASDLELIRGGGPQGVGGGPWIADLG